MKTKLFELKPCPQCKGTGDAHHQGHDYDCGDCLGTGYEEPQGRIINLELMLNEHKMALKSSDAHNNELAQKLEIAWEQRDELLRYNEEFRKETLICADCDAISKGEYDQAIEQRDKIDSMYHKIIKEVLECDPIPACKRKDDQLQPPWEVIARVREQRDKEREIYQKSYSAELARSNHYKQQRDRMAEALREMQYCHTDKAERMANEALQSLTTNEL
jgi:hypothetical protein